MSVENFEVEDEFQEGAIVSNDLFIDDLMSLDEDEYENLADLLFDECRAYSSFNEGDFA